MTTNSLTSLNVKTLYALALAGAFVVLAGASCSTTPAALERSDKIVATAQTVSTAATPIVSTVVPPPWNAAAQAGLALMNALLIGWNAYLHRKAATSPQPIPIIKAPLN